MQLLAYSVAVYVDNRVVALENGHRAHDARNRDIAVIIELREARATGSSSVTCQSPGKVLPARGDVLARSTAHTKGDMATHCNSDVFSRPFIRLDLNTFGREWATPAPIFR